MTDDQDVPHSAPAADPFDPELLRINSAAVPSFGAKKLRTTIPVKKPNKQTFIRVHPDERYRLPTATIEMKEDAEIYLVSRPLHDSLSTEISYMTLFTAIDRQDNLFLWPVKMPREDGRPNAWHSSALIGAEEAMANWVRVQANMGLGGYDIYKSEKSLPEPQWPDMEFRTMLEIAFRGRFIESLDHPVIAKLQGRS